MVSSVLVSWHSSQVQERTNEYYAWLLMLETAMIGVFLAFDIILFYVFFELTLVPLFFLIGIWGGPERRYAARKFFIYTLAGSLITLLGLLGIVIFCYTEESTLTFAIPEHTRQMEDYGGLADRLRLLACFMVFISLTSVGLPGLNGFVGEVLVLMGMFDVRPLFAVLASAGIVLGAWYLLRLLLHVFFGPVKEPGHGAPGHGHAADMNVRELAALVPIAVCCVLLGVYPQPVLETAERDLKVVAHIVKAAQERSPDHPKPPAKVDASRGEDAR
jgi:NADH:ubiquinone oxidoreductase subunit 4 (subunit M)